METDYGSNAHRMPHGWHCNRVFALSAVLVTWKYTGHEFFWWTIPHAVIGAVISGVGFAVAILPFILKHIDKKTSYKK